jgi:hypothetical protein
MFLRRRLAAFAVVIASLAVGASAASADVMPIRITDPPVAGPTVPGPTVKGPMCPPGYSGPVNLATGCPWWMMIYTVEYPQQ